MMIDRMLSRYVEVSDSEGVVLNNRGVVIATVTGVILISIVGFFG